MIDFFEEMVYNKNNIVSKKVGSQWACLDSEIKMKQKRP